ncbi:MBL fold metallo-hydrolase [Actinotalea sp. M2MS4P-6]|uniref:MBL fold metallo-hydrolase n=1 Tax=Actinotalea sp. M2MS4P-6 TaxID=2983762 RepID=UPI0021E463FD|nr:MBL fold metallo-hydrolase [Actinotalea sp. M2MS4P-6]MCV2396160.1 MBL fold metallo-hydrolase [Actinotalea sp. M2MS4P-6]
MRLTVVGCAGSFPGPHSAASCYLVQADDAHGRTWSVLLDLGNGALGPLQTHVDPADLDAVALSHLHPDHVADISGLYVYLRYHPDLTPGRAPLPVHGPFGTASRLADAYGLDPGEEMTGQLVVHTWQAGHPVQVGPMRLTPVPVRHPVPAYGVRVEGPSEQDPDRTVTIAYSGDTDACVGLDDLATEADLLLAEAAFVEGRDEVRGIHLTGRRAGEAAARGGTRTLLLTHVPAWNPPGVAAAEAAEVFDGTVTTAVPGMVVEL